MMDKIINLNNYYEIFQVFKVSGLTNMTDTNVSQKNRILLYTIPGSLCLLPPGMAWFQTLLLVHALSCNMHKHIPLNFWSLKIVLCPGWCGSVYWVWACEPKHRQFYSQSGHMPGLQARSPVGGVCERKPHTDVSPCLSPSLPL